MTRLHQSASFFAATITVKTAAINGFHPDKRVHKYAHISQSAEAWRGSRARGSEGHFFIRSWQPWLSVLRTGL